MSRSALISGVDDDAAELWADAFEELMGPLGAPQWLIATAHHAWRVPRPVATSKARATGFAGSFDRYVPGTRLIRAGMPEATEFTLRAERDRRTPWCARCAGANPAPDR